MRKILGIIGETTKQIFSQSSSSAALLFIFLFGFQRRYAATLKPLISAPKRAWNHNIFCVAAVQARALSPWPVSGGAITSLEAAVAPRHQSPSAPTAQIPPLSSSSSTVYLSSDIKWREKERERERGKGRESRGFDSSGFDGRGLETIWNNEFNTNSSQHSHLPHRPFIPPPTTLQHHRPSNPHSTTQSPSMPGCPSVLSVKIL